MAIAINNYNTTQDKSDLSVGQCGLFLARKMAYDAEMAILAALSNRVRTLDFIKIFGKVLTRLKTLVTKRSNFNGDQSGLFPS